jgi:hypothetical protein
MRQNAPAKTPAMLTLLVSANLDIILLTIMFLFFLIKRNIEKFLSNEKILGLVVAGQTHPNMLRLSISS